MRDLVGLWPFLLSMFVLIVGSALFSGSEAALFSVTPRQRRTLSRAGWGGRMADGLLRDPERLLSAVLFWNLMINMTYFALATIVASRVSSSSLAIVVSIGSLVTIIFFSEMLPKSFALQSPVRIAALLAPPISLATTIISPVLPLVTAANQLVTRLIWPNLTNEPELDLDDIQRAIDLGTDDAALLQRERIAMRGLVELADVRAGEWMRTRGKWQVIAHPISRDLIVAESPEIDSTGYILVQDPTENLITESISPRSLRPNQMDAPEEHLEAVTYVPWSARVSQVLDSLNQQQLSVAVVLDEFGSWMGAITIDDILHRVLVPEEDDSPDHDGPAISAIGESMYRVAGDLGIRVIARRLGVTEFDGEGVTTVAGYLQRNNERFPRVGDTAILGDYELVVDSRTDDETWVLVQPLTRPSEDSA